MDLKIVHKISESPIVNMGNIRLRQPLPVEGIEMVDPFLLLHHYGPYAISPFNNPFDVGAHPHRGFEPITLLFKGEQLHRDSLGNEVIVEAGDVQWVTAGRGIVHSEGPTKEFIEKTGDLEGIQLWLNLPANKKMIPANYQHIKASQIPIVENIDKSILLKVIAGGQKNKQGLIKTQTSVNVFTIEAKNNGKIEFDVPEGHKALVYLLQGKAIINKETTLLKGENQMITFKEEGSRIELEAEKGSVLLFLSGEPIKEKVTSWGPYVMNSQTEIMEALRDYKQGKMGFLY
ncbi:pirin family protein [Tenacibaculum sp. E3R01]|uniref:pirin family protein n=1 Tax=Tenacibaculum sp. E3R01 TaxID=2267227 RepID=UPI000DE933A3|nr:pirin family protein [Tenacibaculum sp. E3R01]RBW60828.1 pirin family protein [Tenacibaculum sp. E3R01]